jgi:Ti-type conjugative transfer relaxase TraA
LLSISTIATGPQQTARYYTESHGQIERYYEKESQGVWVGGESFGLNGKAVGAEFQNLLDGRSPEGTPLVVGNGEKRRVGYDLTFSADKSVSILWARADDETRAKIESLFQKSVENTLKYIESDVMTECVRRGKGGAVKEAPKGLAFATFRHGSSRAQDPQLHTHCVLLNMAQRKDGTFGAIDPKQVFKEQTLARKMFAAEFSTQLSRELKIEIKQTRDGFRIEGVPDQLIKHYSKRKQEIEKEAKALGVESAHGRERIALNTRDKKQGISQHNLLESWQTQMDSHGFTLQEAQKQCFGRKQRQAQSVEEVIRKSLAQLGEHHSTFTESKLKQKLAENSQGAATIDELKRHYRKTLAQKEIVKLGRDGQGNERFTTATILQKEKELMAFADTLSRRMNHKMDHSVTHSVLNSQTYSTMSEEQRSAAQHVFGAGDVAIIQGAAGSGKSFTMAAVREAYEKQGYKVIGLAPTGKAADELARGAGIPSLTVDKYLYDRNKGQVSLSQRDIVIVDESGMLGSTKMRELLNDAHDAGAKIVLVGDHKQLQPIDFGNPFAKLKTTIGGAELNTVRRQQVDWQRSAAWDIREGRAFDALTKYENNKLLKVEKNALELKQAVAFDYLKDRELGGSQLILASTNAVTTEINQEIRKNLKSGSAELSKRRQFEIAVRDREGNKHEREFCISDRVYFTKNNRKIGVQNGSLGTIEHLKRVGGNTYAFEVALDNDSKVQFTTDKYDRIDHGYAVTIHKSQGATVDKTYVVVSSNMDRESAYVAMTRHRQNAHIYASKPDFEKMKLEGHSQGDEETKQEKVVQDMAQKLNRSQIKEMSIDYIKPEKVEQVIAQSFFAELKPLPIHHEFANAIIRAKSRDEISSSLGNICITPAGVDNEYKRYPTKHAAWQEQALETLKTGDYSRKNLQSVVTAITNEQTGVAALFTDKETEQLKKLNQGVHQAYEQSIKMNQEIVKEFVSPSHLEIAQKIKSSVLSIEQRAQAVKDCYAMPSGAGPEFNFFMSHGTQVQKLAQNILTSKDLSQERMNTLADLIISKEVGGEAHSQTSPAVRLQRALAVDVSLKQVVEHSRSIAKREQAQEFKTINHEMFAERLSATKSNAFQERADLILGIAHTPRGVGSKFGLAHLEPSEFQKFAMGMLQKKDLSKLSINKLNEMIKSAPLGNISTDKEMIEQSNTLKESLQPYAQGAVEHAQKIELKHEQERSRGHGMSR